MDKGKLVLAKFIDSLSSTSPLTINSLIPFSLQQTYYISEYHDGKKMLIIE